MRERLARSAGLVGLATIASRLLGLLREFVQGVYFGTGHQADAFVVATRIPMLLRDLFAEGAMSAAFVPTVTRYLKHEGPAAAWRLGSQVINGLLLVTGTLVVLGIAFAGPLTRAYVAEDFAAVAGKLELTTVLTRVNMPFLTLVALAAACMGMLNAARRFFVPASSPALYNIVFILCALLFIPMFQRTGVEPVMALSIGMLLGGVAQVVIQWPVLWREGYRHRWILNLRDPGLRQVLLLMGPGTLGVAAVQINLLVNTLLATREAGAPAALGYAFRLMYVPIGVFGVSVATAALPELARDAAAGDHRQMRATLSWSLRLMLMFAVPATVGLMILAAPIVELALQYGAFTVESTRMVAAALFFYALGIVGYAVLKLAAPCFYALQDARTPVLVSILTIIINLILNVSLSAVMGFRGLALGTAIAAAVNAYLLLFLLSRRLGGIQGDRIARAFAKITAASLAMGAAAYFAELWLREWLTPPSADRMLAIVAWRATRVGGAIAAAVVVLAGAAYALRIEEFHTALRRVLSRKPDSSP